MMKINTLEIEKLSQNRKEKENYISQPMGSIIKFKRKEMNLTLQEASEGICSISYLSKLENNVIQAGNKFIYPLVKRFGLDEAQTKDYKEYNLHLKKVIKTLIDDTNYDKDLIKPYLNKMDYKAKLISMGQYIANDDYIKAMSFYSNLKLYLPNLNNDEFLVFIILTNIYMYENQDYSDAYKVLSFIHDDYLSDDDMKILVIKWRLLNSFRMNKIVEIMNDYNTFTTLVLKKGYYNLLKEIEIEYIKFEATLQGSKHVIKTVDETNILTQEQKDYVISKSLFYHQEHEKVIRLSKKHYYKSSQWSILHIISLDHLKKGSDLLEVIAKVEKSKIVCNTIKILISHMRYKYATDTKQLLAYLRRDILGFKNLTDDYCVLEFLMTDSGRIFSSLHYYKEAVQVVKKYSPMLKSLRNAE